MQDYDDLNRAGVHINLTRRPFVRWRKRKPGKLENDPVTGREVTHRMHARGRGTWEGMHTPNLARNRAVKYLQSPEKSQASNRWPWHLYKMWWLKLFPVKLNLEHCCMIMSVFGWCHFGPGLFASEFKWTHRPSFSYFSFIQFGWAPLRIP